MPQFVNTNEAFNRFGKAVTQDAKRNLTAVARREGVRAKWKGGKPTSKKVKTYRGKIDASGALRKSLTFKVSDKSLEFSMLYYGYYVDQGRKKGKGVPPQALEQWFKDKPIRPRDKDGKFIPKTRTSMNSLSFLINRKIKYFGIQKTRFFSKSFEKFWEQLDEPLREAIIKDLDLSFE